MPEVNAHVLDDYMKKNEAQEHHRQPELLDRADGGGAEAAARHATIKRVVVSTYQSVSGAGKDAMDELWAQTKGKYVPGQEVAPKKFPKEIAFNCIPHIDVFMEDGYTKEEWKMIAETKKILDPKIKVDGDLRARAGVRRPLRVDQPRVRKADLGNRSAWRSCARRRAAWCSTSARLAATSRRIEAPARIATYISRIREDATVENGLNMWVVSDNLRKGAALNAIQIAEVIVNKRLMPRKAA